MSKFAAWTMAFAVMLAASGGAEAASYADVKDWAHLEGKVAAYDRNGAPVKDELQPSRVEVGGLREWLPEFNLVQVDPVRDLWVQSKFLNLSFCAKAAEVAMPGSGGSQVRSATSFGSGGRCPR